MTKKIIYWSLTVIVSALMLFSGFAYFTNPEVAEGFAKMGFEDYFRVELGTAKILGAIVWLIPAIPGRIREWTFAGFSITFISAFIAHISIGDPLSTAIFPLVVLGFLSLSHLLYLKIYGGK